MSPGIIPYRSDPSEGCLPATLNLTIQGVAGNRLRRIPGRLLDCIPPCVALQRVAIVVPFRMPHHDKATIRATPTRFAMRVS